ncbi:MMPL family transporter [Paenibacillus sp. GCM10027626]|uniref:MMPL family transporter n=1 Tax=Paenibacillus sp. GCM10027626 TaxID=3273411 RepID=UPI003637106C
MHLRQLASISFRHPKAICLLWLLFLLFFGYFAPKLGDVLGDHGLVSDGAYAKVERLLSEEYQLPHDPVIMLFEKRDALSPDQFRTYIRQALQSLQAIKGINMIIPPFASEQMISHNYAYALLDTTVDIHGVKSLLDEINRRLPASEQVSVKMTGKPVVQADVNKASFSDLSRAERIGIPLAFIILLTAFGGILSAIIPIVTGMIGVAGTMGIMYWLGTRLELSSFMLNVIPMVGLALSIDFALLMVSRFREELRRANAEQALTRTMATAGRAVVCSAATIFFGLFGILFIPLPMFTSIALGAMVVLIISVLLTLTLVPAILSLIWPVIKTEKQPRLYFSSSKWRFQILHFAMAKPIRTSLAASLLLLFCVIPLQQLKLAIPDASSLPQTYASRMAFEHYERLGLHTKSEVYLVAYGPFQNKGKRLAAAALIRELKADPMALRVQPLQPLLSGQSTDKILIQIALKEEASSSSIRSWLRLWEQKGADTAARLPFLLGGEAKYEQEVYDAIFQNINRTLLFILISNYIVLFLAFRSILIPLKTILMNLLSLGAAFGILVSIFQNGLFGMEPVRIAIMIPVFIFGLVFGISMDYGVFLLSRIFEVYQETGDNRRAVQTGLASVSRVIGSAAAIIITVTLPFALGEVVGVKQLGIGIAAAIFIDATIVRMLLVPALMVLLGKWNWWAPGR